MAYIQGGQDNCLCIFLRGADLIKLPKSWDITIKNSSEPQKQIFTNCFEDIEENRNFSVLLISRNPTFSNNLYTNSKHQNVDTLYIRIANRNRDLTDVVYKE